MVPAVTRKTTRKGAWQMRGTESTMYRRGTRLSMMLQQSRESTIIAAAIVATTQPAAAQRKLCVDGSVPKRVPLAAVTAAGEGMPSATADVQ